MFSETNCERYRPQIGLPVRLRLRGFPFEHALFGKFQSTDPLRVSSTIVIVSQIHFIQLDHVVEQCATGQEYIDSYNNEFARKEEYSFG